MSGSVRERNAAPATIPAEQPQIDLADHHLRLKFLRWHRLYK